MQRAGKRFGSPEYAEVEPQAVDNIVRSVGYDRALEFVWGDDSGPYAKTFRLLRDANRPVNNALVPPELRSKLSQSQIVVAQFGVDGKVSSIADFTRC